MGGGYITKSNLMSGSYKVLACWRKESYQRVLSGNSRAEMGFNPSFPYRPAGHTMRARGVCRYLAKLSNFLSSLQRERAVRAASVSDLYDHITLYWLSRPDLADRNNSSV